MIVGYLGWEAFPTVGGTIPSTGILDYASGEREQAVAGHACMYHCFLTVLSWSQVLRAPSALPAPP